MSEHRDLKARVLQYLEGHRGERVFLSTMAMELGEEPRRIQQSLSFINRQGQIPLTAVVKGHTWEVGNSKSTPNVPDQRNRYIEITTLKSGAVLLERGDGTLFKGDLTEVE